MQNRRSPLNIELTQLQTKNSLHQVQILVKHEEVRSTQKIDSHPVLIDYGDAQITTEDKIKKTLLLPIHSIPFQARLFHSF